jgi:molecular chaperone GrpE
MKSVESGGEETEDPVVALKTQLNEESRRNQELLTRLKYAQADLENLRKRSDRETREAGDAAVRNLVTKLLSVRDELELAVEHADGGEARSGFRDGIGMISRNLDAALESVGVERIECVGKPFDPSLHEAVDKVQGGKEGEDMVVEEMRPGFTFRGQLLRPSMVKVELASREPPTEAVER